MPQVYESGGPAERIHQLIDIFKAKTLAGLARRSGVQRSTLSAIVFRNSISPQIATVLSENLKVRREWIQFGSGEIFMSSQEIPDQAVVTSHSGAWSIESDIAKGALSEEENTDLSPVRIPQLPDFVFVRKAKAKLSSGHGIIPEEIMETEQYAFRLDWLKRVSTSPGNVILFEVDGDSMHPTLQNGNFVLVDRGRNDFRLGRIFAIGLGVHVQCKRLDMRSPGQIVIMSDNPMYGSSEVPTEDIRIIGQVIWAARTFV